MKNQQVFLLMSLFTMMFFTVKANNDLQHNVLSSISHDGFMVKGTPKFIAQVIQCLQLLELKAPEDYIFVKKHVNQIIQHKKSGMVAWEQPTRYEMSAKTAYYSVSWCASTIAHDAYHSYLYQRHKPANGERTPARYWAEKKAESLAISYQRKVAKKIGASHNEQNYLWSLKGNHADIDGDGKLTQKDYDQRDW